MWPFKKTKKKNRSIVQQTDQKIVKELLKPQCPMHGCLCYDCPSRGGCTPERDMRISGACFMENGPRFLSCSWKKHLKGEFDHVEKKTITVSVGGSGISIKDVSNNGDIWSSDEVP